MAEPANSTMKLLEQMAEIMRNHGVEIFCEWEGELDDEEQERFDALVALLDLVETKIGKRAP